MPKKLDRYEFIWKAIQKHGYKYDYRKVNYINANTKICIICPKHGEFWQKPGVHIFGQGCPKCGLLRRTFKRMKHINEFIDKAKTVHENKYDYSKVVYKGNKTKVCIICPEHGEFWQRPNDHLSGYGCPMCNGTHLYSTEEFIEKAKEMHGDKYDYSKVVYKNSKTKVSIICPIHGTFYQMPYSHLQGFGCPICRESKIEIEVSNILKLNQIKHIRQHRPLFLINKKSFQSLDFYLPEYNIAIECQGIQHYKPCEYFGGEKNFEKIIERDKRKLKLCFENNIKILYYTKPEFKTTNEFTNEQELLTFLKNIKNERTRNFSNNNGY